MKSHVLSLLFAVCLSVLAFGCIPSEAPQPPANDGAQGSAAKTKPADEPRQLTTAEDLLDEWKRVTANATGRGAANQHRALVQALAGMSSDALMPLLDAVADKALNPYERILTVQCIADHMTPAYLDRLTALIHDPTDATTRASAVALLSNIDDPRVEGELRAASGDKERRVSFAALLGLAKKGDSSARARLIVWYAEAETTERERTSIVLSICRGPVGDELKFLTGVLIGGNIPYAKIPVVEALSQHGDGSILTDLRRADKAAKDPALKNQLQVVMQAIEERLGQEIPK